MKLYSFLACSRVARHLQLQLRRLPPQYSPCVLDAICCSRLHNFTICPQCASSLDPILESMVGRQLEWVSRSWWLWLSTSSKACGHTIKSWFETGRGKTSISTWNFVQVTEFKFNLPTNHRLLWKLQLLYYSTLLFNMKGWDVLCNIL